MTATDRTAMRLDSQGYFTRGGKRIVPVGVNYWPGSCGVEIWLKWPEAELRHDLDVLAGLGLNAIRFFLRWPDFEPRAGEYDRLQFARLQKFVGWCRERGLLAHPSLFVGNMSGAVFWPEWKRGRNVFADELLRERARAYAAECARALAPCQDALLAIDLGNELCCLSEAREAPPAAVESWHGEVCAAIRSVCPKVLLVAGHEQQQVIGDSGCRLGAQPGTDFYSMHGYPYPGWLNADFDGMTDPFAQSLLPFLTKCARAFGPVMAQEFGTIATFGARQQDAYLRGMLPACWEAGANGFLWWCLRNISPQVYPYRKHGFESTLGLVDENDRVKPGLEYFLEFARGLPDRPAPQPAAAKETLGLYWPRHYYPRDNRESPGNQPCDTSRRMMLANHLLQTLGCRMRIVRGDLALPAPQELRALVIAGPLVTELEAEPLAEFVRQGGRLVWHGPDPMNLGPASTRLLGARPVDYRTQAPTQVRLFGENWRLFSYPRAVRVELEPDSAKVLARDAEGFPAVLSHSLGQGRVVYAPACVEDAIADAAGNRQERDRWAAWYRGMLSASD